MKVGQVVEELSKLHAGARGEVCHADGLGMHLLDSEELEAARSTLDLVDHAIHRACEHRDVLAVEGGHEGPIELGQNLGNVVVAVDLVLLHLGDKVARLRVVAHERCVVLADLGNLVAKIRKEPVEDVFSMFDATQWRIPSCDALLGWADVEASRSPTAVCPSGRKDVSSL